MKWCNPIYAMGCNDQQQQPLSLIAGAGIALKGSEGVSDKRKLYWDYEIAVKV